MRKSNPDFHHIRSYILMCVVSLTFSTIYAQTPEPKLTLKLQNTSLSEVIRQIEQDTGFSFIYGEEVKLDHKVSLNVQKKPLREVLNLLFANKPGITNCPFTFFQICTGWVYTFSLLDTEILLFIMS